MMDSTLADDLEDAAFAEVEVEPETDVRVRLLKLAERLFTGGVISSAYIRRRFQVSRATAKRDVALLNRVLGGLRLGQGFQPAAEATRPRGRIVSPLGAD